MNIAYAASYIIIGSGPNYPWNVCFFKGASRFVCCDKMNPLPPYTERTWRGSHETMHHARVRGLRLLKRSNRVFGYYSFLLGTIGIRGYKSCLLFENKCVTLALTRRVTSLENDAIHFHLSRYR